VEPAASTERAFTGVVSARIQGNLGFRVGGKIIERLVDTGQSVKLGQPLMKIERADLDLSKVTCSNSRYVSVFQERSDERC
jgi:multidrug efflux pump subunit AcrA (membrane-fusion protein)